jgi:hypothetical protein
MTEVPKAQNPQAAKKTLIGQSCSNAELAAMYATKPMGGTARLM